MKIVRPGRDPLASERSLARANSRFGISALTALALLMSPGASSTANAQQSSGCIDLCRGTLDAYVTAAMAGIGAVAAVGIILAVKHDHHFLKGCVSSGPNGPQLQTSDAAIYALGGDVAGIKIGEKVKLHGSKVKKVKGSTGALVFTVESLKRDYGPCRAMTALSAIPAP